MATYPYISGAGNIAQIVTQLRKSFPNIISSETIKKLGLAPNNESYVINVLQFVEVIDSEGKKTPAAANAFSHHKDEDFSKQFATLVSPVANHVTKQSLKCSILHEKSRTDRTG